MVNQDKSKFNLPELKIKILTDWEILIPRGSWQVGGRVVTFHQETRLNVSQPAVYTARLEKYDSLPIFDPKAAGWIKGAHLKGLNTQETTAKDSLDPTSLKLYADPAGEKHLEANRDYAFDPEWGTFGRLESGAIQPEQPIYASYRCGLGRLDGLIYTGDGTIVLRQGIPHPATPQIQALETGELLLAALWIPPWLEKLTPANLFPLLEETYPEEHPYDPDSLQRMLPKTMRKLLKGEALRILAWGDSVTDASYLPDPPTQRWQEQFIRRLREHFPTAAIELVTLGWGGRNTQNFLDEPPGSPYNYREQVLGSGADLIISEFVNDAYLTPEEVEKRYTDLLMDFNKAGMEWIILTPHYVRPDWMDLTREKEIDEDPRLYIAGLRAFAARHAVPLADTAKRWGRLWRQGIPYTTLLSNAINHPNPVGLKLYADSLMAVFTA